MKRIVWLFPVFSLFACAEREKVEQAPAAATEQPQQAAPATTLPKLQGLPVKKPFVGGNPMAPHPTATASTAPAPASASASAK